MLKLTADRKSPSWRRNVYAVCFTELVAMAGCTVVVPILPLYVQELVGVQHEQDVRMWAGVVFGAGAAAMAVFGPIWGALSDRYGYKVMLARAMFSAALLILLMGFVENVQQLVLLFTLQGALGKTSTPAMTLVGSVAPRERAGYALGMLQVAISAGALIGPLLGGLLADSLGYRAPYRVAGVLLFLAMLGVVLLVKEDSKPVPSLPNKLALAGGDRLPVVQRVWGELSSVLGSLPLLGVLAVRLLVSLGAQLPGPVLPLFIQAIAPTGTHVAFLAGLSIAVSSAGGAVGALTLGRLGDRVGHRQILTACAIAAAVFYALAFLVHDPGWFLPVWAGKGLAMGGILASSSASLAQLAAKGRKGIIYGVDLSMVSIANAIGAMTGSILASWMGVSSPFLFAAAIFVLAGLACAHLLPKHPAQGAEARPL